MSLVLLSHRLTAQAKQDTSITKPIRCSAGSPAATVPRIVYVEASVDRSADARSIPPADLYAQSVAERLRLMFHPRGDTLPSSEPAIEWRGIETHKPLLVTVYRNAAPSYRLLSPHVDSVAATMLLSAARTATDSGEGPFWPDSIPGDSVTIGLSYVVSWQGQPLNFPATRTRFAAFYVMFPPEVSVTQISKSTPRYPDDLLRMGATATLIVEFRVDATGHYIPGTATDIWNPGQKRLTGDKLAIYNEFLQSVLNWLPTAEFTPARFGNCPIPQVVTEPFTFSIRH